MTVASYRVVNFEGEDPCHFEEMMWRCELAKPVAVRIVHELLSHHVRVQFLWQMCMISQSQAKASIYERQVYD